uniref:Ig-like domain-containing protein n=1 Tax=Labrus bergylta TaxID=56723 RepID=A0A3Q3FWQ8_9LABR
AKQPILLLTLFWWCLTAAMSVTEVSGKKITIICSHTYATSNVKYFCKGACNDADILITSRTTDHSNKYSLKDEGNTFSVTISDLTVADSGTYWCGIERVGVDTYNQVVLTVTKEWVKSWLHVCCHALSCSTQHPVGNPFQGSCWLSLGNIKHI